MWIEEEAFGEATSKRQLPLLADTEYGVSVLQSTVPYKAADVAVINASGRRHAISEHRADALIPLLPWH